MSHLVRLPIELYRADAFEDYASGPFTIGSARATMWLAQLAYEDDNDKVDAILKNWKLKRLLAFERPLISQLPIASTGGFLALGRDVLFVAFEGTDPLLIANWVTSFHFVRNATGVHRGFDDALETVWPDIAGAIANNSAVARVVVTGHSLGGALAALAARRIADEFRTIADAIYIFGMPRVGSLDFSSAYNAILGERTCRLVHGGDIVPTVPPSEIGFCHVGRYLACVSHGRFNAATLSAHPSDEPPFLESWLAGTRAGLRQSVTGVFPQPPRTDLLGTATQFLPPGVADHLPDRYRRALGP